MASGTISPTSPTANNEQSLESLLFKATNPTNRLEDVNTIKQFCDAVNANVGGEAPTVACRLLAHKIQSPQEREALQALAVLEACVISCGPSFHIEVGKFKFLNEMIKLVSPKYLASRTPEHIKKKTIELLYVWSTKELKGETKIAEAYSMLKKQGIVTEDPAYVGGAVFASALPPRRAAPLSDEQTQKLRKLLQSKNQDDLQQANKIIKGMVQEDERKMDALTKRATELTMVNNNAKLLGEMLDHYDKSTCGSEEKQLLHELFQSCEKMQPKLFRLAAETEEDDESSIGKILQASDDITRVIDRYKMVIIQGKPDILAPPSAKPVTNNSDQLLDLLEVVTPPASASSFATKSHDDDILSLMGTSSNNSDGHSSVDCLVETLDKNPVAQQQQQQPSIDDLLNGSPVHLSTATLPCSQANTPVVDSSFSDAGPATKFDSEKASRQRGLEELDFLGESALRQHMPQKSPQFTKKKEEKVTLSALQHQQRAKDLTSSLETLQVVPAQPVAPVMQATGSPVKKAKPVNPPQATPLETADNGVLEGKQKEEEEEKQQVQVVKKDEVKLADLNVPLSSIKPGNVSPMTLQESDDGISIVLHFGKDCPREHVTAIVVTVISKLPDAISNFELKAVVPKGCKVKLQPPSTTALPAHSPFVPPSAITQVMLIANPLKKDVSLKYILSYSQDDEPQTEMGQVDKLPI